jgi:glycosyltransferase involved in cell wall biosynthesis
MIPEIDIVLTTFNGEKYLSEQIESIIAQDFNSWRLLIRDDGSNDNTVAIIEKYCSLYPNKIVYYDDNKRLGPGAGFLEILKKTTSQYCMFCDQDDIWNKDKVSLSLSKIKELDSEQPSLVFTNLSVTDSDMNIIDSSFWNFQNVNPKNTDLASLLYSNVVTGCTMIVNRELINIVDDVPDGFVMHDWWFSLCASVFGKIDYVNKPTIEYRQHSNNDTGAKRYGLFNFLTSLNMKHFEIYYNLDRKRQRQAELFSSVYGERLSNDQRVVVTGFIDAMDSCGFSRIYLLIKNKYFLHRGMRLLLMFFMSFYACLK